jgi:hypothetical protein
MRDLRDNLFWERKLISFQLQSQPTFNGRTGISKELTYTEDSLLLSS